MDPIARQRLAEGPLRLRDLVFVMGKNQITSAAMDIKGLSQILGAHRRALDMPTRSAQPPRALPGWLTRFAGFPKGKIQRRSLALIDFHPRARFQLVDLLPR